MDWIYFAAGGAVVLLFIYMRRAARERVQRRQLAEGGKTATYAVPRRFVDSEGRDWLPNMTSEQLTAFVERGSVEQLPENLRNSCMVLLGWWEKGRLNELGKIQATYVLDAAARREYGKAVEFLDILMGYLSKDSAAELKSGGGINWATAEALQEAGYIAASGDGVAATRLGRIRGHDGFPHTIELPGTSHIAMFAPNESGKNQRFIMPSLMSYSGPVICLDPKGENYAATAFRRHAYGRVFKLAPWDEDTDCFNPLDFINDYDDAIAIADLLIPRPQWGERFWSETAQSITAGFIYYLKTSAPPHEQNMEALYDLFNQDPDTLKALINVMLLSESKELQRAASNINDLEEKLRQNIWQTARTELRLWASPGVAKATKTTTEGFDPAEIMRRVRQQEDAAKASGDFSKIDYGGGTDEDGHIQSGDTDSVFLIVPTDKIAPFASFLRVVLGTMLLTLTRKAPPPKRPDDPPRRPLLFIFDELAQLGYMEIVERMMSIARGYDVRLWLVFQSLSQISSQYKQWQSMLENAHAQVYFGELRGQTAEFVSIELGERKDMYGSRSPLISPQELAGPKFDGKTILRLRKVPPVLADLEPPFYDHPHWDDITPEMRREQTEQMETARRARRSKHDAGLPTPGRRDHENQFN